MTNWYILLLDSSYYFFSKLPDQILKLLRQIGKCFLLNFFRNTVLSLGYSVCDGDKGITITPYGDGKAKGTLEIVAF